MRKKVLVAIILFFIMVLSSACGTKITYPHLEYLNSNFRFDVSNKTILLEGGYVLNDGNSYDVVETEDGYDMILHFVKG